MLLFFKLFETNPFPALTSLATHVTRDAVVETRILLVLKMWQKVREVPNGNRTLSFTANIAELVRLPRTTIMHSQEGIKAFKVRNTTVLYQSSEIHGLQETAARWHGSVLGPERMSLGCTVDDDMLPDCLKSMSKVEVNETPFRLL